MADMAVTFLYLAVVIWIQLFTCGSELNSNEERSGESSRPWRRGKEVVKRGYASGIGSGQCRSKQVEEQDVLLRCGWKM